MSLYGGLQNTASRLLKKFGKSITVQVPTGKVSNPATMSNDVTYTESTGYGVTLGFKNSEVDGTLILKSDIKLIIENIDLEPIRGSLVSVKGNEYRVQSVMPLNPADINLIYTCVLRR